MQPDAAGKDPGLVLSFILGRKLTSDELYEAFEENKSTYYAKRKSGQLVTADSLIKAARHLGINPIGLLTRYGLVTPGEVIEEAADTAKLVDEAAPYLGKAPTTTERRTDRKIINKILRMNAELSPREDMAPL